MFGWFERRVSPYPDTPPAQPPQGFFSFIWFCTKGLRGLILCMTLLTACIGAFEALLFSMMGSVVDWLAKTPADQLWQRERGHLFLLGGILLGSVALVALQAMCKYQGLFSNFPMRLRWNFHRHLLGQSLSFYQDEFAGRVSAKVMQTSLAVRDTVLILTDIMVFVVIYFVTMIAVLGHFDLYLLLPFLAWLALYVATLWFFVPRLGKAATQQADARSLMTGRITDAYTNIATVKLFSHGQREARFAKGAMQEFLATAYRQMRLVSGFEIVNQFTSMLLVGLTAGSALWLWSRGEVSYGAVAAAIAMALRLNGISHWIMWEMSSLFENIGTVQDGITTLSRRVTVLDKPDAAKLEVPRGEIRFENVDFSYGGAKSVIANLNLTIRPGEKIGLVGRSGAGKSTIVNLLLRFYDLDGGRILIDGQDIAGVTQDSLRAKVGMVTQDTSLLHRSVRDNLLYGRPDAGDEDMIAAARKAEADEFIRTLSDPKGRTGYDAHVGERGVKLSGGQRQRIAIARVMLKDAPILLLDEATSALDSEVEAAIQSSLYRLMEGKTVVAIAHRLSTIAAMDRLIVLDRGQVVEQGTHQQLLSHGGLYARLWAHQSGGFLGEEDDDENDSVSLMG
ncbi:ABC transporter ATP-binding protein [Chromobacterium amazonense]|uniref:ABC transporter ATP-binding protein n=1 Tax=Chromobacterium amazonense TaxID=1382803 RepID=A0ABU8V1A7_9NEIS|nr:ABC transporter ATP-binding protein [Chromobacterium amazonense]MBM2886321.1 ABC transporter ATP-binding protein [Chromobacterium amazonense]MDE1713228.1 ABC transporter ATP-binding protein [Chromobacterium amazonense]MDQ4542267.1 ABC transporter ATP-binding protein [Chromobacterium amazonense]OHX15499.1 multidrug ABC transporter ATP-binding protein [Chromobacterium amazonense]